MTTPVISTNNPQMGKLVDLDPEQQMVSQVWGLQLCIGDQTSGNYVLGNFRAVNFRDITFGRTSQPPDNIGGAGATYLSVIDVLRMGIESLAGDVALRTAGGNLLSVRFVVDLYDDMAKSTRLYLTESEFHLGPRLRRGRAGQPQPIRATSSSAASCAFRRHRRRLQLRWPTWPWSSPARSRMLGAAAPPPPASYNYAPSIVDAANDRVSFDFGNSLCVTPSGESYPGMGTLQAAIAGGSVIGPIPATTDDYTQRSWIYDFFGNGVAARRGHAAAGAPRERQPGARGESERDVRRLHRVGLPRQCRGSRRSTSP